MKKCVKCGSIKNLTKDHIIPQWLWKRLKYFNLSIKKRKKIMKKRTNIQILCAKCNEKKGAVIDYNNELTIDIMTQVKKEIEFYLP